MEIEAPVMTFLKDENETVALGGALSAALLPGAVIFLEGDLGAGKTTLTRGVLRAQGHEGAVKSPTYTLCEPYLLSSGQQFCHFDLYRLSDPEELEYLGFRDYLAANAILFIEWPSRGEGWLPSADLTVSLSEVRGGREVSLTANTETGELILDRFGARSA